MQLWYPHMHGKCNKGDSCNRYHGPETPAMQKKRLKDEKQAAEKKAATAQATPAAHDDSGKAEAKAARRKAAKAKAEAKKKAEAAAAPQTVINGD